MSATPRRTIRLALGLIAAAMALMVVAAPSGAQSEAVPGNGIDVVQVEGLLDPPNAALMTEALRRAEERGSTMLVFQLDSGGAVDVNVDTLIGRIEASDVPVVVWVGPSGAAAQGGAAELVLAAPWATIAPGSGIGPAHPQRLDDPSARSADETAAAAAELLASAGRPARGAATVTTSRVGADQAETLGLVDEIQPTVGDVIVSLDGVSIATSSGDVVLSTAEVVETGAGLRRQPNQEVRFQKLSLWGQLQHTLATPWVAYFAFVAGLCLIVFEFYTVSIGLAGAVGAGALVGAFAGLSHLPVQWWALVLLALGILGFTIDVQAGRTGPWTMIGGASLIAGSVTLYGGSSRLDPPWWVVVIVVALTGVFMLGAMPSMLRTRFSTPTVGREGIIGEMGRAEVAIEPEGVVRVRDALWRASTNRATPIAAGDTVRVVAVEGLLLEVEPETGGARDYRERRKNR